MSATCTHPDAEAALHPECAGCRAEMVRRRWDVQAPAGFDVARAEFVTQLAHRETERVAETVARLADEHGIKTEHDAIRDVWLLSMECNCAETCLELPRRTLVEMPRQEFQMSILVGQLRRRQAEQCECILGELLPNRDLTPDERAAHDVDPRPGVWVGDDDADGRELTQEQTDALIRAQLAFWSGTEVRRLIGEPHAIDVPRADAAWLPPLKATRQRGGIDSDPMVRLLAYRAWGDRDRLWFERD